MDHDIQTGILVGQKFEKFLNRERGYYLSFDGVIRPKTDQPQLIQKFPWIFHHLAGRMKCPLWQTLHFGCFNTISQYCIEHCWKVVIIPCDVIHLFWMDDFLSDRGFDSKAGLDMRTYTFGMYRAFVYFDNRGEAKRLEADLKVQVGPTPDNKNKYYNIFTKRGCTEFENKLPSPKWEIGDHQPAFEDFLKKNVDQGDPGSSLKIPIFNQPEWLKHLIRLYWAQSAYASGDSTWQQTPYAPYVKTSKDPVKY